MAALNTLPPAERDATWLRRVFEARAPLGPYELTGLYLDAFSWTGTAATATDIVHAVARVFPGVQLVQTECGLRFRGLVRARGAASVVVSQEAQARKIRTERNAAPPDAYASCSSRPSSPRLAPTPIGKRKRSPELEPSKRVRTAQGGAVKADDALDMRMLHEVGTSPVRMRADDATRLPSADNPPRSTTSIGTQTVGVCKTYAEAGAQTRDTRPQPAFSVGTQTIGAYETYAEVEVQAWGISRRTYAEAAVQARDSPQIGKRPPDRDALLADPHAHIPADLLPLRVPREIVKSTLPDQMVRIVQDLRRGEHGREEDVETFRAEGEQLEYLGTYVFRPTCVRYSRAVHEALGRAVLVKRSGF